MVTMTKRIRMSVILGALLLVGATACGSESDSSTESGGGASGGGSGSGNGMQVTVSEPADGASVQLPFMLRVNSSVPLGPTESGDHHIHVFFDGNSKQYEVVESDSVEISSSSKSAAGLSPGKHELDVSLRNADHSPAGVETKLTVDVGGSGGGGGQPQTPTYSGGGGGY
jgi:hypothetical protein